MCGHVLGDVEASVRVWFFSLRASQSGGGAASGSSCGFCSRQRVALLVFLSAVVLFMHLYPPCWPGDGFMENFREMMACVGGTFALNTSSSLDVLRMLC